MKIYAVIGNAEGCEVIYHYFYSEKQAQDKVDAMAKYYTDEDFSYYSINVEEETESESTSNST